MRHLHARPFGQVVCEPAPGGGTAGLARSVLGALGKDLDVGPICDPLWRLVQIHLGAERVRELILLRAHTLTYPALRRLADHTSDVGIHGPGRPAARSPPTRRRAAHSAARARTRARCGRRRCRRARGKGTRARRRAGDRQHNDDDNDSDRGGCCDHRSLICQGRGAGWRVAVDGHGGHGPLVGGLGEQVPDAAGEVALEAAVGLGAGLAFGLLALEVGAGAGAAAGARDGDPVQRVVELAVAPAVESDAVAAPGGGGDRGGADLAGEVPAESSSTRCQRSRF